MSKLRNPCLQISGVHCEYCQVLEASLPKVIYIDARKEHYSLSLSLLSGTAMPDPWGCRPAVYGLPEVKCHLELRTVLVILL